MYQDFHHTGTLEGKNLPCGDGIQNEDTEDRLSEVVSWIPSFENEEDSCDKDRGIEFCHF